MITRMQIPRQLYNQGGISSVPLRRENFGIGSSFKKFVRKIIPKEIAQVAVKAAPFVAPFNPAVAGAMSGLGTFQQTGSIGKSLGQGALNYGGGQAARYLGGAGFQGNPFTSGAFTPSGFTGGFSSPLGDKTGLGKFLSDRRIAKQPFPKQFTDPSSGMLNQTGAQVPVGQRQFMDPSVMLDQRGSSIGQMDQASPFYMKSMPSNVDQSAAMENLNIISPQKFQKKAISDVLTNADANTIDELTSIGKGVAKTLPKSVAETSQKGLGSRIVEKVKTLNPLSKDFDFTKAGDTITDLGGKALSAVFTDGKGNLDKTAIMAALITVPTFLEARGIANEAGLSEEEFTEDMFNAAKSDSKETYESNLGSFFEGTGYTGNLAKGGLIRENYAYGDDDPSQYPEEEPDMTIFELMKDQGVPVGEQTNRQKIIQGAPSITMAEGTGLSSEQESMINDMLKLYKNEQPDLSLMQEIIGVDANKIKNFIQSQNKNEMAQGGRVNYALGTPPASEAGLGRLPVEADMRYSGGFMPYGEKEKADDVPARLSKNEFVFTADAVRAAGGGSMQKGAQRMYDTMKTLEGRTI